MNDDGFPMNPLLNPYAADGRTSSNPERVKNMKPPRSPPFSNYEYRDREDVMADNDSDASYDTDEERKRWQFEEAKEQFPECYAPIPRGVQTICYCCRGAVVFRTEKGRKLLECEAQPDGFVRHYCRWWDEAIVEDLQDRIAEAAQLQDKIDGLERIIHGKK